MKSHKQYYFTTFRFFDYILDLKIKIGLTCLEGNRIMSVLNMTYL